MTNCNLYKKNQFYGEKKVVVLAGLEPTTMCDQAKFDLNAITARPRHYSTNELRTRKWITTHLGFT